jgi:hypothetical protein
MQRGHPAPVGALALLVTLAVGAVFLSTAAKASPHQPPPPYSFAVIGDVPYGDAAQQHLPAFIDGINADPDVRMVTHLGDVKNGSTTCDDLRLEAVRRDFDRFTDPLVHTPGDNEWTDCHRANNGAYQPLERLEEVRRLYFDRPGTTLGRRVPVTSLADRGLPEDVRYERAGLSFATLHVVGSNDDLQPWTGIGLTSPTPAQVHEERARTAGNLRNLREAFRTARRHHLRGVVLQQQADMFDPTVTDPSIADYSAFRPLVQALVHESRRFHGAVYLFNGDSHRFNVDQPLAAGSHWLSFYGVRGSADNLRRVTVDGSDLGEADWLKVIVQPRGRELLTFEQAPGA